MGKIEFAQSSAFTLGVELEFQILDKKTLNLAPMAPEIMEGVPEQYQPNITPEFLQSIVEVRTGICSSVGEAGDELRNIIQAVEKSAEENGCLLFSSSLHPFAKPESRVLSFGDRYHRIMKELQYVGRQFMCQGLHVHIGMADRETAITVCDAMQAYLPLFLALSSSSPFFRGEDTGFSSYRTKLFEALPLAGLTSYHGSWKAFEKEVRMLKKHKIITDFRDLWWDIRPSPIFGTVEIRICDLPARFSHILGLVALIQAMAVALADGIIIPQVISHQLLSWNRWQAARHGLAGTFTDPFDFFESKTLSMKKAAKQMVDRLEPYLELFGTTEWAPTVKGIIKSGTSTDRQRMLIQEGLGHTGMLVQMHSEYWT